MRTFDVVVAADKNGGIGKDGTLPWQLPGDMAYFKKLTTTTDDSGKRNAVIMGRKTWLSIPERFRPLKQRLNIVLTSDRKFAPVPSEGVLVASSLDEALALCGAEVENVFVIGGGVVYAEALKHPSCRAIYLTEVQSTFECDTFLPDLKQRFVRVDGELRAGGEESGIQYRFVKYLSNNHQPVCSPA